MMVGPSQDHGLGLLRERFQYGGALLPWSFPSLGNAFLVFVSWLAWPEMLRRSAFQVLLVAFFVHTLGLAFRVILQGRPPVTNLYSSAVFVGWAGVALGIALERLYRKGFGIVAVSAIGFATLIMVSGSEVPDIYKAVK